MSDTLPCAPVLLTLAALDRGQEEKGTLDVHFARNSVLWHRAGRSRSAEVGEMQKAQGLPPQCPLAKGLAKRRKLAASCYTRH